MSALRTGLTAAVELVVGEPDTAAAVGSGDVPVLATPRLLALAEAATVAAVGGRLGAGRTSVGTHVVLEHRRSSPVGAVVVVRATLVGVQERVLRFEVVAEHADGVVVARGEVVRVVVDRDAFLARE